jgi:GNAT superfamily N-acetyltransferase
MDSDEAQKANRDLVASWVAGWALSRDVGPPTPAFGGFRVDVGLPDQKARYVFPEASQSLVEASLAIQEPNIFLKVCASPEQVRPLLHPAWSIRPVGFMMTASSIDSTGAPLPADYHFESHHVPAGYKVSIIASSGELAANGGVYLVGATAIFDRIQTNPAHRRRGLGRAVMSELGRLAHRGGASTGTLVATPNGRALYSAIGWRLHSLYTTASRE